MLPQTLHSKAPLMTAICPLHLSKAPFLLSYPAWTAYFHFYMVLTLQPVCQSCQPLLKHIHCLASLSLTYQSKQKAPAAFSWCLAPGIWVAHIIHLKVLMENVPGSVSRFLLCSSEALAGKTTALTIPVPCRDSCSPLAPSFTHTQSEFKLKLNPYHTNWFRVLIIPLFNVLPACLF